MIDSRFLRSSERRDGRHFDFTKTVLLLVLAALWAGSAPARAAAAERGGGLPTVSIGSVDTVASESGPDPAQFSIIRSGGDLSAALRVDIALSGTATRAADYTLAPAVVTAVDIPANASSIVVVLEPRADNLLEGTEQAVVTLLENPTRYTLGASSTVSLEITDDPVEVNLTSVDLAGSEAGPDVASFSISRSGGDIGSSLTVGIGLAGSAGLGSDYTLTPAFVTAAVVPAGQVSGTVVLTPLADNLIEGLEQVDVGLTPNPAVYTLGAATAVSLGIADDPVRVRISTSDPLLSETNPANTGNFIVSRSGGNTGAGLTVGIAISGTATLGTDYTLSPAFVTAVAISPGQPSVTVVAEGRAPAGDEPGDEGEETITVDLVPGSYLIDSPDSVTLILSDLLLFSDSFESQARIAFCAAALAEAEPNRFVDQGASVFDLQTGLTWSRCGPSGARDGATDTCRIDGETEGWPVQARIEAFNAGLIGANGGHTDWRQPTATERAAIGALCSDALVR